MKYLSLDLETTGLSPTLDQILMLSAVVEDSAVETPVEELPHYTCFVKHARYTGNAFALHLNSWILQILSGTNLTPHPVLSIEETKMGFARFLDEQFGSNRIVVAGKNVAGFDIPFLKESGFSSVHSFLHRVVDPGSVMIDWSKNAPPSLGDIKAKVLGDGTVAHDAYQDALDVIRVLRTTYRGVTG